MSPRDTDPAPPPDAEDLVIPRGQARTMLVAALANVAAAIGQLTEIAEAMARALDVTK